jgi:hypothetical protein
MVKVMNQFKIRDCGRPVYLAVALAGCAALNVSAEIVFQDFFTQLAPGVSNIFFRTRQR